MITGTVVHVMYNEDQSSDMYGMGDKHSTSKQDVNRTLHSKTELEHLWRVHVCVYGDI